MTKRKAKEEKCTNPKIFPHGIQMKSLRWLNLSHCSSLQHFPDILEQMDELERMDAAGTGIKQIPHSICYLPGLQDLILYDNYDLISLPESINQLDRLRHLEVIDCLKLQQISGIPSNLGTIYADGCISLTSQSSNAIWSQALQEINFKLDVAMPRTPIPNWFDHCCKGGNLSFWSRRKFPYFAFAVVLSNSTNKRYSEFDASSVRNKGYNNGRKCVCVERNFDSHSNEDCIFLLGPFYYVLNFNSRDWNHVEIKCRTSSPDFKVDECGVYVYKQDINMEDIQFECPIPNNSNIDSVMSRDNAELRDKIEEAKRRKRSRTEYMSRNDEKIGDAKPRKKFRRVMSRNDKELEAEELPRRFIKKSPRKRIGIYSGWRRQVFPPLF